MDLSPLTVVVLLAFGLLIAFCLTLWTTLGNYGRGRTSTSDGDGPAAEARNDRLADGRRATVRNERPASERRQEPRRADRPAARIRTEPTPVVLPSDGPKVRRTAHEEDLRGQRASAQEVDSRKSSRPKRGKDDDDAFERFLKAKDEFDIR